MNHKLIDVLVCPLCKGELLFNKDEQELICRFDKLAYPVRDDIPVMLEGEARKVSAEELDKYA
ncbi:Trm112 family protein [Kangiella sediminilitoris]|uniref:UPF0434 protein KS2013_1153 n=1 Tax=Kangiella sediminilitoris TaxID=1144748 RepID=A0A1B3BAN9_9GAMM|nr:Trm112 family protein [Kangiella sediminilitoris]AOE49873.1 hypothetical protein KS2013_1153 [Kangiella sediminilitoris]